MSLSFHPQQIVKETIIYHVICGFVKTYRKQFVGERVMLKEESELRRF